MPQKLVSLVRGENRKENIHRALELIKGDLGEIEGKKTVLIKPNLTDNRNTAANTHRDAIEAVIEFLNENFPGKEIIIGEASGSAFYRNESTTRVFETMGYTEVVEKFDNVKLESFDDYTDYETVPIRTVVGEAEVRVAKRAQEFDYKISLAIPKTHNFAIATFGIKNLAMGFVKPCDMSMIHGLKGGVAADAPKTLMDKLPKGTLSIARRILPKSLVNLLFSKYPDYFKAVKVIHHNIASLADRVWPDLVILDGFYGMEGDGPVVGDAIKLGIAIASTDALKADGVGARAIGFDPGEIGYLYYLRERGKGDYSLEGLVGEKLEDCVIKVKPHGTYMVQRMWRDEA